MTLSSREASGGAVRNYCRKARWVFIGHMPGNLSSLVFSSSRTEAKMSRGAPESCLRRPRRALRRVAGYHAVLSRVECCLGHED